MNLGMAPPLSTLLPTSYGKKILRDHTPAHVALKSTFSFIAGSQHGKRMFQGADRGLTAGSPVQRSLEPTLFLPLRTAG
jgi:hypothetical protein